MSENFYPNTCYVCNSRSTLKRCSCCRLIYYCGEAHQKKNWKNHKEFCSAVNRIAKSKGLSHIYEDLKGCSSQKWAHARGDMILFVISLIKRDLHQYEMDMLHYPRSCIVCYDTNSNNLTDCLGCPLVSFCKDHPDTSEHDKICPDFAFNYNLEKKFQDDPRLPAIGIHSILNQHPKKNFQLPSSISEFLDQQLESFLNLDESIKLYASMFYCSPLTVLNIFKKLNYVPSSELTIHICRSHKKGFPSASWEILFHLLPSLNKLTLVVTESNQQLKEELKLCQQCSSKKKKLIVNSLSAIYIDYVLKDKYKVPDLIIFENLIPQEQEDENYGTWKKITDMWPKLRCPVAFMVDTDKRAKRLQKTFNTTYWKPLICFQGMNEFASLRGTRDPKEWEISNLCRFLVVTKAPSSSDRLLKSVDSLLKEANKTENEMCSKSTHSFNAGVCHVCKTLKAPFACKHCKMIFYCGSEHAKMDWISHKEICTAIVDLLKEKGTSYLLDNLKFSDNETWREARFDVIREIEKKLNRQLLLFETKMFLFPRACIVCHESDLSALENCKCGVSLCKLHMDDSRHKSLCKEFDLEMKLTVFDLPQFSTAIVPSSKIGVTLPPSIDIFIKSSIMIMQKSSKPFIKDSDMILVSSHLTRPATLVYTLKRLKYSAPESMVVHIIEADNDDINFNYWKFVLDWLENLNSILVVFIGVELEEKEFSSINPMSFLHPSSKLWEKIQCRTIRGSYDQYFESGGFLKPDVVMDFNMEIRNCRLTASECTLSKTLSIIRQMDVPFIMTAVSEIRVKRNIDLLATPFGGMNKYEIFEKNPYGSLFPQKDFESDGLCYGNYFLVVYVDHEKTTDMISVVSATDSKHQLLADKNKISTSKKHECGIEKNCFKECGMQSKVEESTFRVKDKLNEQVDNNRFAPKTSTEDSSVQRKAEGLQQKEKPNLSGRELLKENLLLQEENKMLKENLQLQEKNLQLKKENLVLQKKLSTLKVEESA